ncbi:MAG: bifunctional precorrin-2 dehydrogenase/sirohydrochlorin ferrochelatase, partial [Lachnospiraceae bacterium]|nr:bifunctional precorrin-2 dehydrogenase/sirohydrochlorin ferrochelatase [Lachnospiraceae bacterium]
IRCLCESGRISWKDGVYQEEVLEEADLVLAATDDAVCNEKVVEDCRERGILVNTSHKKELCDFYFPGIIRQGDLVMGICSGGMSHREVKEAREKMERALKEG